MIVAPAGMKVHVALGCADMRKGIDGLVMLVRSVLKTDTVYSDPGSNSSGSNPRFRLAYCDNLLTYSWKSL